MDYWILYIVALIPLFIGGIFWIFNKRIIWQEWLAGSLLAFIIAGGMHGCAISGLTDDVETWSGQITDARHYSTWKEYYEYAVYRTEYYTETEYYTDSQGRSQSRTVTHSRQVFDHWEPTSRWHGERFDCNSNINTSYDIDKNKFDYFVQKFNNKTPVAGRRSTGEHNSRMMEGDPNDYVSYNKTGWIEPVTKKVHFENRIKAAPTTFSFAKVPENVKVFPYPANNYPFRSDRLIGSAAVLDTLLFDQMNARLGPTKKINVIMVGMGDKDSFYSQWQEAAWLRGKKNDFVIVFGGLNKNPKWVRVFSWGEGIAARNVEALLLKKGITNEILPELEAEIKKNFVKGDWSRFNYLTIEIPPNTIWIYLGVLFVFQTGFWIFAHYNDFSKISLSNIATKTKNVIRYNRYDARYRRRF